MSDQFGFSHFCVEGDTQALAHFAMVETKKVQKTAAARVRAAAACIEETLTSLTAPLNNSFSGYSRLAALGGPSEAER